jgi:hypothetical protein
MNGFETIVLLGGYLILFGILCAFIRQITFLPDILRYLLLGVCEITTGVNEIAGATLSFANKYILCVTLCSFGGLCTLMQTLSIIKGSRLSPRNYLIHKILFAMVTLLLAYLYRINLC